MSSDKKEKLWKEYSKKRTAQLQEEIILEYIELVKIVGGRMSMYLGNNVEYDDLIGYGVFGLIDAIDKFDYEKGIKFETYASLRIRGSILDHIRKMDWIPRSTRQKQKKLESTFQALETQYGRQPRSEELAKKLEISLKELAAWEEETNFTHIISLDNYISQGSEYRLDSSLKDGFSSPETIVEKNEVKQMIADSLDNLRDNEKTVITLYYYEELTLKEISKILEVSESRVSQIHTKALKRLKEKLGDVAGIFTL